MTDNAKKQRVLKYIKNIDIYAYRLLHKMHVLNMREMNYSKKLDRMTMRENHMFYL